MKKLLFCIFLPFYLFAQSPFVPLPKNQKIDKDILNLGKALFNDPNLSRDKKISCSSCHKKEFAGADNKDKSVGVFGRVTKYNVPSIYNLKYQFVYGLTSKKYSLKEKIEEIIENPDIMDMKVDEILNYLRRNRFYKDKFLKLYKKIDKDSFLDVLQKYIYSLTTPDSKYDRYLRKEIDLSEDEKKGEELFKKYGCIACHNGKAMGGHLYFKYGYFLKANKKKSVKCPSLRNVEKSAPYFHDGSIKTLKDAVKWMAKVQLGKDISDEDANLIATFLKTLTGKMDD